MNIDIGTKKTIESEAWLEVISGRECITCRYADLGPAEEVICLLEFAYEQPFGKYEVGIGAALRPYQVLYRGNDEDVALARWSKAILNLAGTEDIDTED